MQSSRPTVEPPRMSVPDELSIPNTTEAAIVNHPIISGSQELANVSLNVSDTSTHTNEGLMSQTFQPVPLVNPTVPLTEEQRGEMVTVLVQMER